VRDDAAVVVPDDAVHDGQSQPRPLARGLGGEERIEHPVERRWVHAGPGIGDD